jgi:hypothetical protein
MNRFMRYIPFWKKNESVTEEFVYIEPPRVTETPVLHIDPDETWYTEDHTIDTVCVSPLPIATLYHSPFTHINPQSIVHIYPTTLQMPPPPPPPMPHPQDQRIMVQFDESKLKELDIDIPIKDQEDDDLDMIKRILLDIFN